MTGRPALIAAVLAVCFGGCRDGGDPGAHTALDSLRVAAAAERLAGEGFVVDAIDFGRAGPGWNPFETRVTNHSADTLQLGLDLRAVPGFWFGPNRQDQFAFRIPPGDSTVVRARYELAAVSPESALRVRFAPVRVLADGRVELGPTIIERRFEIGRGNPAADSTLASWVRRDSPHFDFFALRSTLAEREADAILRMREAALEEIAGLLSVAPAERIRLVFYPDGERKRRETGHTGAGLARGSMLVEIYSEDTRLDPYHELAHILAGRLGNPPAMLDEGFATWVTERLGGRALEELGHPGSDISRTVCRLASAGQLLDLVGLAAFTEIGSEASRPAVAYPQSASVVGHLVRVKGMDRFKEAFAVLAAGDDPDRTLTNAAEWRRIFGETIAETEAAWRRSLGCGD